MAIPDGHAPAQRRSLAYHRKVAERLDADVRERARALVERWAAEGTLAGAYAERWRALLDLPQSDLAGMVAGREKDWAFARGLDGLLRA